MKVAQDDDSLTEAEQDVWAVLIVKHGLSYEDARKTCNRVANDIRSAIKAARDDPDVPPEVRP